MNRLGGTTRVQSEVSSRSAVECRRGRGLLKVPHESRPVADPAETFVQICKGSYEPRWFLECFIHLYDAFRQPFTEHLIHSTLVLTSTNDNMWLDSGGVCPNSTSNLGQYQVGHNGSDISGERRWWCRSHGSNFDAKVFKGPERRAKRPLRRVKVPVKCNSKVQVLAALWI